MGKGRAAQVREAVHAIRELHRNGRTIPRPETHKEGYGQNAVALAAEKVGLSAEAARQARQFADPIDGYTVPELDHMCALIRSEQPNQDEGHSVFGATHVVRLLTVPKKDRVKLMKAAVTNGWSVRVLASEIAARYGKRRSGGRRRAIPDDAVGLLVQVDELCEVWRRWLARVDPERETDSPTNASLADLPEPIRKHVQVAGRTILRLQEAVDDELRRRKPKRAVRSGSRTE